MYTTSHQREFKYFPANPAPPLRPSTTEFGAVRPFKIDNPVCVQTSNQDFHGPKPYCKSEPIRSGTATGNRRNNPHPDELFISHKLSRNANNKDIINDADVDRAIRSQFRSTYGKSFNGLPQGFDISAAYSQTDSSTEKQRVTEVRENYLGNQTDNVLKGSTTRYGSALSQQRLKNPAVGSVPGYVVLPLEHQTQETVDNLAMYKTQFCNGEKSRTVEVSRTVEIA